MMDSDDISLELNSNIPHNLSSTRDNISLLKCPHLTNEDKELYNSFSYWVGGVGISCVAIPGLCLNLVAICVLIKSASTRRNNFNPLIASLCGFDSVFLLLELIDAFRKYFNFENQFLILIFPHVVYPIRNIAFAASIFMTVAIAYERYSAIKYPIQHHQLLRSRKFRRNILFRYISAVIIFAVVFNLPKFFETKIQWNYLSEETEDVNETMEALKR